MNSRNINKYKDSNTMELLNVMKLCRFCLCPTLNYVNVLEEDRFVAEICGLLHIEISWEDGFPPFACHPCINKIKDISNFKKQCFSSRSRFKEEYSKLKNNMEREHHPVLKNKEAMVPDSDVRDTEENLNHSREDNNFEIKKEVESVCSEDQLFTASDTSAENLQLNQENLDVSDADLERTVIKKENLELFDDSKEMEICENEILSQDALNLKSKQKDTKQRKNELNRLLERHFVERLPQMGKKARPQRRCVVCTKNGRRKETVYWCPDCNVSLCMVDCFRSYHTLINFGSSDNRSRRSKPKC